MYGYGVYGLGQWQTIILLIAIAFSIYASQRVKSSYIQYVRVKTKTGLTGQEVARRILNANGISNVQVVAGQGLLSDHYNHNKEIISLSPDVFHGNSISSAAIAAHEVGHAIQKNNGYSFFRFRDALAKPAQFASSISWIAIIAGIALTRTAYYFQGNLIIDIGIAMFATITLFHLITLPVELNASSRALEQLVNNGIIYEDEKAGVRSVLRGAALTYVAALSVSLANLLRVIAIRNR